MLSLSESLYHTHLRLWSLNLKSSWFTGLQAISMKLTSQVPTCPNRHPPPVFFDFLNAIIFFSTQLFTLMGLTWTLSLPDNVQLLKSSISFTFLTTTFHLFNCLGSYLLPYPAHWLYKSFITTSPSFVSPVSYSSGLVYLGSLDTPLEHPYSLTIVVWSICTFLLSIPIIISNCTF